MNENTAEKVLELAAEHFDAAEVYEETSETLSVSFEDNRLKEIRTRQLRGVGLRVIHKGRVGFASSTDLRAPERLIEMAATSAGFGDKALFEFPAQPEGLSQVVTYDRAVLDVSPDQMVQMGNAGLEKSRAANDGYLFSCGISRTVFGHRILNTGGLDFGYQSTEMAADVGVQEVTDEGILQVYEFKEWSQPFESVMDLTDEVLRKMAQASRIVPGSAQEMPMVFAPKALNNLLMPIEMALDGKNVHKGSSVLAGRLGERILDERLTITDDPSVPFAPGSCPMDDEGTPAHRLALFEGGVLRTFIADLQTAALLGCEATGHGFRGYSSRPHPATSNTVISAGDVTFDRMLAGMERGMLIDQTLGSGQSNLLAGEFSVNLDLGFLVEGGEVKGRVKDCMVAGNVYEVLGHVEAIGSEQQWLGEICAPPIMVAGLKLAV
jgi:PmbA protein